MHLALTNCSFCGRGFESAGSQICPQCTPEYAAVASDRHMSKVTVFDLAWAFVVWGVSGGFLLALDIVYRATIWLQGKTLELQITTPLVIASLVLTMLMHVAGFVAAWLVVTRVGNRPFWQTLGWGWHPRFKWFHAVGLAIVMLGVAVLSEKLLPHKETDLERFLKLGFAVKVMVAALAVLTAPLIEEIVYRGVVYASAEGLWGRTAAVVVVTALFAAVHVPQYWGSWAANVAILSLSLVLTLMRAWTGSILPCVVTHLVYNGIQAGLLLVSPDQSADKTPTQAVVVAITAWLESC
jgi:uncharacterized protein